MSLRLACPRCRSPRVWPDHTTRPVWVCVDCAWVGRRQARDATEHTASDGENIAVIPPM